MNITLQRGSWWFGPTHVGVFAGGVEKFYTYRRVTRSPALAYVEEQRTPSRVAVVVSQPPTTMVVGLFDGQESPLGSVVDDWARGIPHLWLRGVRIYDESDLMLGRVRVGWPSKLYVRGREQPVGQARTGWRFRTGKQYSVAEVEDGAANGMHWLLWAVALSRTMAPSAMGTLIYG